MPKPMSPGYGPLLSLSIDEAPASELPIQREDVLRTVLAGKHTDSVRNLLEHARENLRVSRSIVPEGTWTYINEAHEALKAVGAGTSAQQLLSTLEGVGRTSQLVTAQITETMTRDDAYAFFDVGRFLERGNMILRVLQMSRRMHAFDPNVPFDDVRFMGLLHCLGSYQMYKRRHQGRTTGHPVLTFLLKDADFPRSLAHCLVRVDRALSNIPGSGPLRQETEEMMTGALPKNPAMPEAFAEHRLEALAELSDSVTRTYFHHASLTTAPLRFTAQA
jgi:uncharacterized alpha-E superfamily protein